MAARRFDMSSFGIPTADADGEYVYASDYETLATLARELAEAVDSEGTAKSKTRALARKVLKALEGG